MNDPFFVLDLRLHWALLQNYYMQSPARLISVFDEFMHVVINMFVAIHNETSDELVLVDNYINGSYVTLAESARVEVTQAVTLALDVVVGLADIHDATYPGKIKQVLLDPVGGTLLIQFGGENDAA